MITNKGKGIIGKYMLGQAPAYASYIAIGCGPKPLSQTQAYGDYSGKTALDFEMFRIPISSRGFVNDGTDKIVLTGELPTEERYEITEIGIFSAGSNSAAGAYDSKVVAVFTQTENWQYHQTSSATAISTITESLDGLLDDNVIATTEPVFQTNADNNIFYKTPRTTRLERCRFFNNTILMRGDTSTLTVSGNNLTIGNGSNHIHLTGTTVDLSKNSPLDEIKLAFSIVSKNGDSASVPDAIRIIVEFASTDETSGEYARFQAILNNGTGAGQYDFTTNRYYVIKKQLQELLITSGFTWSAVNVIKIYACAIVSNTPSANYYIALDALRFDNISTENVLYGLTGYSVIKNTDGETIIKSPNTSNYVEFRFSIGVS